MQDAHPDYLASLADDDKARMRHLRRQWRVVIVLACILPAAGVMAALISLLR